MGPNPIYQTQPTKPNLPNPTYKTQLTKHNLPNPTYQTQPTKPNLPTPTYQTQPTKPNLPNPTYKTQPNLIKPNLQFFFLSSIFSPFHWISKRIFFFKFFFDPPTPTPP